MIEGGKVYLCNKKKVMGIYSLELVDNKHIKSKGINFEACKEDICMQIIDWNGDGEAVLEFVPEQTKKHPTGIEMYRSLGYNESVDILNENDLFVGGVCPKCKYGIGKRTNELLNLEWKPKNVLVSISSRARKNQNDFPRIFPKIKIYSKKFVHLLIKDEKKAFEEKEVLIKGKVSDFVELIPKDVVAQCGHKGADYDSHPFIKTWKCTECGRTELHFDIQKLYKSEYEFVDPKSISNYPTMFFLQWGMQTSLVVRNDRWAELLEYKKETKGIATSPVVVLNEEYVEYPTSFYEPEKFEW